MRARHPAQGAARARQWGVIVALLLVAGACDVSRPEVLPPPPDTGPPPVYVSVGASETTGAGSDQPLRDGWPRVLHRTALAPGAIHVNMGIPGATVAQALAEEVPTTLEARPHLVTVWLNVNDMNAGVSPATYETQLESLVRQVRRSATTRVLVANTPPLDQLPAYQLGRVLAGLPSPEDVQALVAQYNAAIARVVQRQGAFLVDLHAVGMAARAAGTEASFISRDGFHPSTAGHARVAEAFAEVLKASGPLVVNG
ncbi:MAG TPA: SGNH/GDSL hydrolase family protein [Acidimicrobiales bacterium]|nr:SGNH/GDSL hydrolase family protein [Acidimicrobiales bacterium]